MSLEPQLQSILLRQSSKRTDRLALASMENFLLGGAEEKPSPAPLPLKSTRLDCARSNSPRRACCKSCCFSPARAMLDRALQGPLGLALLPSFLKPPINRRNFCCLSVLSN